MLNVVKASFYKMFHDKAFWISLAGTAGWALVVIAAQVLTSKTRGITDLSQLANRWYGFIGLHSIEVPLIFSAVVLFSGDFRDKSWKLLIAKGITKTSYFLSKLISMLCLTTIISFISILTIAICNVVILHAPMDAAYVGNVLLYFLGQTLAHFSIAVLVITVICIVKRGEIASAVCMVMMVLGYVILHGIESSLAFGEVITDHWAFSQTAFVEFGGAANWGRLFITFLGYLVICSAFTILYLKHKDVE
ncbi:MAG: ABC transporter permease [Lachnospiraceae bacterium]|nr:ABC transporter permease [Lachnospiraceae bacterium]